MRFVAVMLCSLLAAPAASAAPATRLAGQTPGVAGRYRAPADRIIDAALADSAAYRHLAVLVDRFGPRFSGTENLERALDWILEETCSSSWGRRRGHRTAGAGGRAGHGPQRGRDRYFWYHHTDADTIDKLDAREMSLCVAAMAVMAYVVADLPEPLPHATQ